MPSLTRTDAAARAALIRVVSYAIDLDLTTGPETFRSTVTIRFSAPPDAATFAECRPVRLVSARLNGRPLDGLVDNRIPLADLAGENELVVEAEMAYSNTGEGLHRFVDPADGRAYLFAMAFLDQAQRIFACFDQPDLKAPVTLTVTVDPQWIVLANAPGVRTAPGRWEFAETMPLATYFVTLVAGPYHSVHGEHDGIPLGLHCRASLAEHLDRDAGELLAVTAASFDRLHELFGVRYPFGKYDQAFVPELSAGAMENPGCVTFSDDYVFRSAVTDAQRESRAVTVAHEMAHMWFGDLVTMRWWDDLWLNESFAEYLGVRVTAEATRFSGAWTTFAIKRKAWGYAADQRPSTHPVAPTDVADTTLALLNFDGISYAKGAAALRQLAAWVGDDAFLAGLRAHIAAHRFGNATLADLLAAIAAASGRDLDDWARRWLRTSEVDTLRPRLRLDSSGRYAAVDVAQSAPGPQRPHRIGIGLYDGGTRRTRVEVDLAGSGDTPVPDLTGQAAADLLLLNDGDLSYAKVRLDPGAWDRLAELLPTVDDPVTRGLLWVAAWDAVRDAERPIQDVVALLAAALPAEPEVSIVEHVLETARDAVDRYLDTAERAAALATVREAAGRLLAGAAPGGSHQLAGARGVAASSVDVTELRGWLSGNGVPPGLAVDADLRWRILCRLVVLDAAGLDEIRAEAATDRTATGQRWAATCRAAVPDGTAKAQAWTVVTEDTALSGRLLVATAAGFWQPEQGDLCSSYVDRYFAEMPAMARIRTPYVVERLAAAAFPRYAVHPRTRAGARALLARTDIDPALRRAVVDEDDDLRRALAARTARGDTAG